MPPSHPVEFTLFLLNVLVMAILTAMLALWVWAIPRLFRGEPLLSPTPILHLRPARWGGRTVSAVIFLYLAANMTAGLGYGAWNAARRAAPEADRPAAAKESATAVEPGTPSADHADERTTDDGPGHSSFTLMLLNAVGSVLVLIFLPAVLRRSADVAVSELGFSWESWPRQVGVGVAAALLTTPAVYAIQALAARYWEVNDHDVQKMLAEHMSLGMAAFALVSTVLVAPLVEEALFRGVLLGWLSRSFTPPQFAPAPSRGVEGEPPATGSETAPASSPADSEAEPIVAKPPEPEPIRPNVVCLPAIIVTSLLFAGMHASQWPAPVGIFFLAVVIGVVYQRTGSLLTAMVMHGVFNGCGTFLLFQSLLARTIGAGKPELPEIAPRLQPAVGAMVGWWSSIF